MRGLLQEHQGVLLRYNREVEAVECGQSSVTTAAKNQKAISSDFSPCNMPVRQQKKPGQRNRQRTSIQTARGGRDWPNSGRRIVMAHTRVGEMLQKESNKTDPLVWADSRELLFMLFLSCPFKGSGGDLRRSALNQYFTVVFLFLFFLVGLGSFGLEESSLEPATRIMRR